MNKRILIIFLGAILGLTGCGERRKHFIGDKTVSGQVNEDFEAKKKALPNGGLFDVFNEPDLTTAEQEALTFLYAYMPIGDVTDYSGDFYLENIRASFLARKEMPWGAGIPEVIFRHFVLPVRVNNENLDNSRIVFYSELKDRVKGMSLRDAVLEVNHWCHEKVIYTPSDARTSSPLASVKSAYGRCGEESVFTVAALRSVGIPARQVYTPRWAHTDDNHAWVEAWVDGKWYFMGACEPEPVLNMAWFNAPAYRGMLMHTKVFGRYNGPEEIMEQTDCYTEINVIDNYAPTAKAFVTVTDAEGKPIEGATVEFKLYNYAEFCTVSRKSTDAKGQTFLTAGKGDMLVWATKDGRFGFSKVSFGKDETVTVALDKQPGDAFDLPLDIVPPVEGVIPSEATDEQKAANVQRLLEEDRIRNAYVATFCTPEKAKALAAELGLNEEKTIRIMTASRGNWDEIEAFLRTAPAEKRAEAITLLEVVSQKDLRDAPAAILTDHLLHSAPAPNSLYTQYMLNSRISNELISSYKSFFQDALPKDLAAQTKVNPQELINWVAANITIRDDLNPQRIPILPQGVWTARLADAHSRDIFFVAVVRSLGIPSRIDPVTGKVQYLADERWIDVDFESSDATIAPQGSVVAAYTGKNPDDPKYYSHFTLAKVLADGTLRTLDFEADNQADMGVGDTWSQMLKRPLKLEVGNYVLVTGTRMAKGNVLAQISSFSIKESQQTTINLEMRKNTEDIQVIGSIDAEARFNLAANGEETSILSTTGRGYFIVAILGARQEPTNHALRDIAALCGDFENWGRGMALLFKNEQGWKNFDASEFGTLPNTITYGIDSKHVITDMLTNAMHLPSSDALPIFVIADTFGRVVFVSQGYTIGLGEQLMQTIRRL
ncbi:transglutaminase [Bacteroidia bacterium]|nr:transglutaminase [Bacteroidia bacterium]